MFRNFGISLLLFGLFLAGMDGFRDRVGTIEPTSGIVAEESGAHISNYGTTIPPR